MTLHDLQRRVESTFARRSSADHGLPSSFYVHLGLETARDPRRYVWDGQTRSSDARNPLLVLQYTLSGRGAYDEGGRTWEVGPGKCFIAIVPSAHRYYLPAGAGPWTFFYFVIVHDFVVRRFGRIHDEFGPVHELAPDSAAVMRMLELFSSVCTQSYRDDLASEQAMIDLTLEFERTARHAFYPTHRQQLMDEVRQRILANLNRFMSVDELAEGSGMSRSHFSHYFKSTTGIPPARYVTDVRLQEVARRLTQTRQAIKHIADETGFADANHLCKVFRKHFRTSPGEFRDRMASP